MSFSIEEIYGCNRGEYCIITGVTPSELIRHLELEVFVLRLICFLHSLAYAHGR